MKTVKHSSKRLHGKKTKQSTPTRTSKRLSDKKKPKKSPPRMRPFSPESFFDKEANDSWRKLFVQKDKDRKFYERCIKKAEDEIQAVTDSPEFLDLWKSFGKDLATLMMSETTIQTEVPSHIVKRSLTGTEHDYPDTVKCTVKFGDVSKTLIPIDFNEETGKAIYKQAGDHLCNNMLRLAFKLVGKNIRNIGFVLLIIHQYKSRKHVKGDDRRFFVSADDRRMQKKIDIRPDLHELLQIIDEVMEDCLADHPQIIRNLWTTHSFGNKVIESLINDERVLQYREAIREEWRKEEDEDDLDLLDHFHLALIMIGSQKETDEDGIARLNKLIFGGNWVYEYEDGNGDIQDYTLGSSTFCRIGPKTFLRPLQFCHWSELLVFYEQFGIGLGMQRAAAVMDITILLETCWKRCSYPKHFKSYLRLHQVSTKKARVTLNGVGYTQGVGIDSHGKRIINAILGLEKKLGEKKIDKICEGLPINVARNVNDNLGEIGQSLNAVETVKDLGHKKWLKGFFRKLRTRDDRFIEINKRWLAEYGLDTDLNKIK